MHKGGGKGWPQRGQHVQDSLCALETVQRRSILCAVGCKVLAWGIGVELETGGKAEAKLLMIAKTWYLNLRHWRLVGGSTGTTGWDWHFYKTLWAMGAAGGWDQSGDSIPEAEDSGFPPTPLLPSSVAWDNSLVWFLGSSSFRGGH